MAVNNSLGGRPQQKPIIAEYDSNGEKIRLSPTIIRNYLVSGDAGNVTEQEVMLFLMLCKSQHLNPFLREAYLIKYGTQPATLVTGKDLFTKRASRNPKYMGKAAGIIVQDSNTGEISEREGTFHTPNEVIIGGWAKIYIKGHEQPEYASVAFDEYAGRKKDGSLNSQWSTKPATMIRKVALVQALREAFPEDYEGLYSPEEIPDAAEVVLNDTTTAIPQPIEDQAEQIPQIPQGAPQQGFANAAPPQAGEQMSISSALFNQ